MDSLATTLPAQTIGGCRHTGILAEDMKLLVEEQQLGFHASVCPDGTPNLSPKGSTRVWDDDHLFFGDICSPQTMINIRAGRR